MLKYFGIICVYYILLICQFVCTLGSVYNLSIWDFYSMFSLLLGYSYEKAHWASRHSVAMVNHHNQRQFKEERVYFRAGSRGMSVSHVGQDGSKGQEQETERAPFLLGPQGRESTLDGKEG